MPSVTLSGADMSCATARGKRLMRRLLTPNPTSADTYQAASGGEKGAHATWRENMYMQIVWYRRIDYI